MKENIFDGLANHYDTKDRAELASIIRQAVEPELFDSQNKKLLDYGAGTGLVSLPLADQVASLLLVDTSQQMLTIAEEKIKGAGITNTQVLQADFSQKTPEIKADVILLSLVLLHIPDTKKILQQLFTTLNTGGKLLIIDFDKNEKVYHPKVHNGFEQDELRVLLSDTGFQSTRIETFYHGKNVFMKQDASLFLAVSEKD